LKGKAGKFIILNINEENDIIKSEITNGSTSSSTRRKESFQRIFFGILNDISGGNYGVYW